MTAILTFESEIKEKFPGLEVLELHIADVNVVGRKDELERFKSEIISRARRTENLEALKEIPIFRAYRDFFWRIGIDPTKIRPAGEALLRRILQGKEIPTINSLVDSYNLASIVTKIAIGVFDEDKVSGDMLMRLAKKGESFRGIGMGEPKPLEGNEIVISDANELVALYPYRDAERTKVSEETRNVVILICGVPGLETRLLDETGNITVEYIVRFCGGRVV